MTPHHQYDVAYQRKTNHGGSKNILSAEEADTCGSKSAKTGELHKYCDLVGPVHPVRLSRLNGVAVRIVNG